VPWDSSIPRDQRDIQDLLDPLAGVALEPDPNPAGIATNAVAVGAAHRQVIHGVREQALAHAQGEQIAHQQPNTLFVQPRSVA
jgi:hypothetical protein